jgi:Asp-tRNA(Asn)/Glu-tRNA(Gln) amidotransferase A subunit family amidase
LSRYDGIRYGHRTNEKAENFSELVTLSRDEGFGEEVKRRILYDHVKSEVINQEGLREYQT